MRRGSRDGKEGKIGDAGGHTLFLVPKLRIYRSEHATQVKEDHFCFSGRKLKQQKVNTNPENTLYIK